MSKVTTRLQDFSVPQIKSFLFFASKVSRPLLDALLKDKRRTVRKLAEDYNKKRENVNGETNRVMRLLQFEQILWARGIRYVAGVDEVGLGALAGPVVAAAVIIPEGVDIHALEGVNDSKQVTRPDRERLAEKIRHTAVSIGIGETGIEDIARLNIYHAGREAMRRAVSNLTVKAEHVLIDSRTIPGIDIPQNSFIKGDTLNFSIAAASIVAKVYRDALMAKWHRTYPEYRFDLHKGYGTALHWSALRKHGPCPIHRTSYDKLKKLDHSLEAVEKEPQELLT